MKTINVYSNPEAGAVGVPGRPYQWVGALLDHEKCQATKKAHFVYSNKPVSVPFDQYHRQQIADGSLLPADEESAKMCGVSFDADAAKSRQPKKEAAKIEKAPEPKASK